MARALTSAHSIPPVLDPIALARQTESVPTNGVEEVCGTDPTWVCRRILEATENDFLAQAADWVVAKPLVILLVFAGAWFVNRLVRRAIRRFVAEAKGERFASGAQALRRRTGVGVLGPGPSAVSARRTQRADAVGAVLRSVAAFVVYTLATFVALGELGLNLGPLVAGAGIVGVAVGFGAQSLVRDFLTGLFMVIEDQFGVGDAVDLGVASGTVEGVSLRTTRVRDVNGVVWHVPNGEIHRVGNKSQDWARAVLDIPLPAGTDVDRATTVILQAANETHGATAFGDLMLEQPEVWGVQDLGRDGALIRLVVKTKPGEQFKLERELRTRLARSFVAEGITPPAAEPPATPS